MAKRQKDNELTKEGKLSGATMTKTSQEWLILSSAKLNAVQALLLSQLISSAGGWAVPRK